MNVGKLKARLWIVEPRLRVRLGQRLQTTRTGCSGLTFVGLLANSWLRIPNYVALHINYITILNEGLNFQRRVRR